MISQKMLTPHSWRHDTRKVLLKLEMWCRPDWPFLELIHYTLTCNLKCTLDTRKYLQPNERKISWVVMTNPRKVDFYFFGFLFFFFLSNYKNFPIFNNLQLKITTYVHIQLCTYNHGSLSTHPKHKKSITGGIFI